jgi:hypothetical protein
LTARAAAAASALKPPGLTGAQSLGGTADNLVAGGGINSNAATLINEAGMFGSVPDIVAAGESAQPLIAQRLGLDVVNRSTLDTAPEVPPGASDGFDAKDISAKEQTAASDAGSGTDISVTVSSQEGATQILASAPALNEISAARLKKSVDTVAAELGVSISQFSLNGASLTSGPVGLIGAWNGD